MVGAIADTTRTVFLLLKMEVSKMANQNKNTGGCYILLLTSVLKVSNSYNIGRPCDKMAPVRPNYGLEGLL